MPDLHWERRPNGNLNLMSGKVRIAFVRRAKRWYEWEMHMPRPNVQHFKNKGSASGAALAMQNAENSFKAWCEHANAGEPEIGTDIIAVDA